LWYAEDYNNYATIILLTSIFSVGESLYEYKKNYAKLQELSRNECQLEVVRWDGRHTIGSRELVPGDLVVLEDGTIVPCDLILLNG
jgi:cation-transporting ATPase 13A3/4/5